MNRISVNLMGVLIVLSSLGLTSCLTDNGCGRVLGEIQMPWHWQMSQTEVFGVVEGGDVSAHPHGSSDMKLLMTRMDYEGESFRGTQLTYLINGEEVVETYRTRSNGQYEVESEDLLRE